MNQFALTSALHRKERPFYGEQDYRIYSAIGFNILISEDDHLPSEEDVLKILQYKDEFEEEFDYAKLEAYYEYWQERLDSEPDIKQIFKRAKRTLINAKKNAKYADFKLNQIQIMLDKGEKQDLFRNSIVYVLDSANGGKNRRPAAASFIKSRKTENFGGNLHSAMKKDTVITRYLTLNIIGITLNIGIQNLTRMITEHGSVCG
ncbi:MAG: hypothetical protein HC887_01110 [Desulfobacteraceae bacterium]|nr:hypothetical protein [Desulfobacteraceae bacterium]